MKTSEPIEISVRGSEYAGHPSQPENEVSKRAYYRWTADINDLISAVTEGPISAGLEKLACAGTFRFEELTYPDMAGQRFLLLPKKERLVVTKIDNISKMIAEVMHEGIKPWSECDHPLAKNMEVFATIESDYGTGALGWCSNFQRYYRGSPS